MKYYFIFETDTNHASIFVDIIFYLVGNVKTHYMFLFSILLLQLF